MEKEEVEALHEEEEENARELPADQATLYRSIAARANYLAADRPDIMYAT